MSIAGHVSREMLEHYSHVTLAANPRAMEALSQDRPKQDSYLTRIVTNRKELAETLELSH